MSYQKGNTDSNDLTPLVGEGLSSSASQTNKRNVFIGIAVGLVVAVVGSTTLSKDNRGPSSLRSMDVLMPDGRHNISSDILETKFLPQTVDHFDDSNDATFDQKYFLFDKFWKGPGHPILFILGGEEPLEDLITPFVYYYMAQHFGAISFGVEHRYFGDSFPVKDYDDEILNKINSPQLRRLCPSSSMVAKGTGLLHGQVQS